jgi:hypothetical protein
MLINICFGFMLLIASLIEFSIPKTAEVTKTQDPLGEFRCDQFDVLSGFVGARSRSSCAKGEGAETGETERAPFWPRSSSVGSASALKAPANVTGYPEGTPTEVPQQQVTIKR